MKPITFAINLLWVRHHRVGGTEVFIRNLLDGFRKLDDDFFAVLLVSKDEEQHFRDYTDGGDKRFSMLVMDVNSSNITGRILWQNLFLNRILRKHHLRNVFSPVYDRPYLNGGIRYINVVHDIQAFHFPQYHPLHEVVYSKLIWQADKRSEMVVTTTQYVADDLKNHFGFQSDKLRTIFIPVKIEEDEFVPFSKVEEAYGIREKQYYYTVCQMIPHKNVLTLLRVMKHIADNGTDLPDKLLVSGISGNATAQITEEIKRLNLSGHIILTGFVDNATRNTLYKHAKAFLFPSVFEGFGIPPVEALMTGTNVITTKCTSIPEVTQGIATYVDDPYSVDDWITCMKNDPATGLQLDLTKYDAERIAHQYLELFRSSFNDE